MGFPLDVRVLFGVIGVLFSLGCEPAKDAAVTIPTGAAQLRFSTDVVATPRRFGQPIPRELFVDALWPSRRATVVP